LPLEAQKGGRGTGVPILNLVSGWRWVFKATPLPALPPGKVPSTFVYEGGWVSDPIQTCVEHEKFLTFSGVRTLSLPVYIIPAHNKRNTVFVDIKNSKNCS
jgi:hypothetical protein